MFRRFCNTFFKGVVILFIVILGCGIFYETIKIDDNSFWNIFGGIQIVFFTCLAIGGVINAINFFENYVPDED